MPHSQAKRIGAECDKCPLNKCGRGPVYGDIVPKSKLALVAEAPGANEVEQGRVLVGYSGREVEQALRIGGLKRHQVTLTNCLLCQPPEGLIDYIRKLPAGTASPLDCCRPRLEHDLASSNSQVELAVGGVALQQLAKIRGLSHGTGSRVGLAQVRALPMAKQRGAPLVLEDRVICASYHPAFAARTKPYKHVIRDDIARAARIAIRNGHVDWNVPKFQLSPSIEAIEENCRQMIEYKKSTLVSMDIETDGIKFWECNIRCIGFAAIINNKEVVIVVPFRRRDNSLWWSKADHERVFTAVRDVLEQCVLVGHNLAFDTAILLRGGFIREQYRNRLYEDTMLMHHDTDENDLPHNLGFVTTRYFEIPMWKKDVDTKHVAGVSDLDLHQYNALDVITVLRLAPVLQKKIQTLGTTAQYKTDLKLAVATRNMGELGLVVDMKVREKLSKELNIACDSLRAEFQERSGIPDINPRSPFHLRKWLFNDLSLLPTLNTSGHDWEPGTGEDPSTSVQAMVKLLDRGVPRNVETAINTLLEFRAYDKLRGTYVDNLPYRVVDWSEYDIDAGDEYSLLHTNWKVHITPTGRLASQPNVQNWSSRGKVNVLTMITSPPGHVIVGADMDQLELRIYAAVAGDQKLLRAFEEGLDPHAMNAATLFAANEQEVETVYKKIVGWKKSDDPKQNKKAKNLRNIAKRFAFLECIAEGELVLTQRGLVPIEKIGHQHRVWDGVEWVSHGGVICKGEKEVMTYDGLTATSDHKIWTEDGRTMPFGQAAKERYKLLKTAFGGVVPVPFRPKASRILGAKRWLRGQSWLCTEHKKVRVYDILNAGKRRRFTVSGCLVSNCYGGEPDTLYSTMSTDRDKATGKRMFPDLDPKRVLQWHDAWHLHHPETKRWHNLCWEAERDYGCISVPLLDRRKRFFPGGATKKNSIPNMQIQGSAASMMNKSLLEINERIPHRGWSKMSGLVLQVHDYLGVYVPESRAEEAKLIIEEAMNSEWRGMNMTAEAVISKGWADQ